MTTKPYCVLGVLAVAAACFFGECFSSSAMAQNQPPNIVLITIDDLRPELGIYGADEVISTNIDAIGRDGMVFDRAYSNYPTCVHSRAGLMTGTRYVRSTGRAEWLANYPGGRYTDSNGVRRRIGATDAWIRDRGSFPSRLDRAGYRTVVLGKVYHSTPPAFERLDVAGPRWLVEPQDQTAGILGNVVESGGRAPDSQIRAPAALYWAASTSPDRAFNDGMITRDAVRHIRNRPRNAPLFIGVGYSRPHLPWLAPKKYFDMYPIRNSDRVKNPPAGIARRLPGFIRNADRHPYGLAPRDEQLEYNQGNNDRQVEALVRGYYASISFVDAQVGRIVRALKSEGIYDNTLIVVLSDHGYHLSEHGLFQKTTPFDVSNRIPMMIAGPGVAANSRSDLVVELADVYPTIMQYAGLTTPRHVQGRSLRPVLRDNCSNCSEQFSLQTAFYSVDDAFTVVTDRWRLTVDSRGVAREMYNLRADPLEFRNRVRDPAVARTRNRLVRQVTNNFGL